MSQILIKVITSVAISFLLLGCVSKQYIDVSNSVYTSSADSKFNISKITINDASKNNTLKSMPHMPIKFISEISFPNTVSSDLKAYFNKKLSNNSNNTLEIDILEAEPYWLLQDIDRVPLIGIVGVNKQKAYKLYISLRFKIIKNGKTSSIKYYQNTITIYNSAAMEEDLVIGYKKLVSQYREIIFSDLDNSEFILILIGRVK